MTAWCSTPPAPAAVHGKLLDSHLLSGVLDLTTTEVCDFLFGGVLACTDDRFGAVAHARALCARAGHGELRRHGDRAGTLPGPPVLSPQSAGDADAHHARRERPPGRVDRQPAEPLRRAGALPIPRVSALDAPGQAFWDPEADAALFTALETHLVQTADRRLVRVPCHINDPLFARTAVEQYLEISQH